MEGGSDQLQTKYQKIATEYSKIRAQANVLKKAVIEEQSRTADLQDQLKEKEVEIRRAEQELDSLSFRNQQLTKRVTVLQEELDGAQNRGVKKSGRSKSTEKSKNSISIPLPNHILDEEFQKKIVENAQLVSQLSDKELEIIRLNERIDELESTLYQSEKGRNDLESKHRSAIARLEKEKDDMQRKLNEKKQNGEKARSSADCETEDSDSGYGVHQVNNQESKPSTRRVLGKSEKSVSQEDSNEETESNRLFELEKELTSWKAEYNVMKIKFDQLNESAEIRNGKIENEGGEEIVVTNMLGKLVAPFSIPDEIEARENKIKEYYKRQIEELISEKQVYHIRNLAIAADTEIMNIHLETSEAKRRQCEEDLNELRTSFAALKEDQEIQEGNYKAQLSTISEHLANMNEKLIQQTEEIQQLKFELGNKNAKKGKQK